MTETRTMDAPTRNAALLAWVDEIASLCRPEQVAWCDGSQARAGGNAPFRNPQPLAMTG